MVNLAMHWLKPEDKAQAGPGYAADASLNEVIY